MAFTRKCWHQSPDLPFSWKSKYSIPKTPGFSVCACVFYIFVWGVFNIGLCEAVKLHTATDQCWKKKALISHFCSHGLRVFESVPVSDLRPTFPTREPMTSRSVFTGALVCGTMLSRHIRRLKIEMVRAGPNSQDHGGARQMTVATSCGAFFFP